MQSTQNDTPSERDFADKISYAFQLATAQGPMCHEPMQGVAVFLEQVTISAPAEDESSARETLGRLTGEVIKTVRDSIRQGFLDWSPRLLLAMYSCEIQASSMLIFIYSYSLAIPHPSTPISTSYPILYTYHQHLLTLLPQPKYSAASTASSPADGAA